MRYVHSAPVHLNGDLFCAIDTETTGLDPEKNSIIEIAVIPLKSDYTVNNSILPFCTQMKPLDGKVIEDEAIRINKINLPQLMLKGIPAEEMADRFVEWYEKLNLQGKKIVPIAHNWPFDYAFIMAWLGRKTYDLIFARSYRDTMSLAASINDRCDIKNAPIPYAKLNLGSLCLRLGVENIDPHRAVGDAVATAEVYRGLLHHAMEVT